MSWYKTGTVSVTQGSNAVIGTGTSFIANSRVGDAFRGPDGEWYEVINIASDTALSISPNYQGGSATGGLYSLAPMQGYVKDSADALRAATKIIASGVADMTAQVAAATEAAESAGRSEEAATAQAGIATSAAETSTQNKDAASQSAQQSQSAAQASGSAAQRSEAARDSIVQSEAAAAESARAAAASAEEAEIVTRGKAASGANSDITSLSSLTTPLSVAQGGTGTRDGGAIMQGSWTGGPGEKGLVPTPLPGDHVKVLSGAGTWIALPAGSKWGGIAGTLADQVDLNTALGAKLATTDITCSYIYPNGNSTTPGTLASNTRLVIPNPFPGRPVIVQVELYVAGLWGEPGWDGNTGSGGFAAGVRAGQLNGTTDIVVQSGASGVYVSASLTGGTLGQSASTVTSALFRLKVFNFKEVL